MVQQVQLTSVPPSWGFSWDDWDSGELEDLGVAGNSLPMWSLQVTSLSFLKEGQP